jgi:hypothetical protein
VCGRYLTLKKRIQCFLLLLRRSLSVRIVRVRLVGLMMADRATGRGANLAVSGHMAGDTTDDSPFDAAFGVGARREGDRERSREGHRHSPFPGERELLKGILLLTDFAHVADEIAAGEAYGNMTRCGGPFREALAACVVDAGYESGLPAILRKSSGGSPIVRAAGGRAAMRRSHYCRLFRPYHGK